MTLLALALLTACGPSQEDLARTRLEQAGLSDVEVSGRAGVYEFKGKRGDEVCVGSLSVPVSQSAAKQHSDGTFDMYCSPTWGDEQLKLGVNTSKQGRDRAAGCDGGDAKACALLGTDYRDGTNGIPGSKGDALRLFEASCAAGAFQGCTYLADVYDRGELMPRDDDKAMVLYEKSCGMGSAIACGRLGLNPDGSRIEDEPPVAP